MSVKDVKVGNLRVRVCHCERCNNEWESRKKEELPKYCKECKTPYWNEKRVRNPAAYEKRRTKHKLAYA